MTTSSKIDLAQDVSLLKHHLRESNSDEIRRFLIDILLKLRRELTDNRQQYGDEEKNRYYACAVSLRGLLDYINLSEIVSRNKWKEDHDILDLVWTRMWDCKNRIDAYPGALSGLIIDHIHSFLQRLENFYSQKFGNGLYFSPDIKIKRRDCSICKDNIKKCSHIPGKLYAGVMCRQMMIDFEFESVSIVENPEDPRCRIWPWNYNIENSTMQGAYITFFSIDDFIQDETWPHPDILWPEGTNTKHIMLNPKLLPPDQKS